MTMVSPVLRDAEDLVPQDGQTEDLANVLDRRAHFGDDPTVIGTKRGRLQSSIRYVCPDTKQMHPTERASYLARLHGVLCRLDADWVADFDWWHEPAPTYPEAGWRQPVDWLVDELRRMEFTASPRQMSMGTLTLSWQPPKGAARWLRNLFLTKTTERSRRRELDETVTLFQAGVRSMVDLLQSVWLAVEPLNADGTATYLHHCTTWDRYAVRMPTLGMTLTGNSRRASGFPPNPAA